MPDNLTTTSSVATFCSSNSIINDNDNSSI
jgi:hypothetical protein